MPSIITLGSRVSAKVGPLFEDPPRDPSPGPPKKRSRRARATYHGTVLASIGGTVWRVYWDDCNKTADHLSSSLKVHGRLGKSARSPLSLEEVSALNTRLSDQTNVHVGSHVQLLDYTMKLSAAANAPALANPAVAVASCPAFAAAHVTTPAVAADVAATVISPAVATPDVATVVTSPLLLLAAAAAVTSPAFAATAVTSPVLAATEIAAAATSTTSDPDVEECEDEVFDPNAIEAELRQDEGTSRHLLRMATYLAVKAELIADNHEVIVKGPAKHITKWTVVDDIKESDVEPVREFFKQPGHVLDFDFGLANRTIKHESGKFERVNLLSLIRHLWPGNEHEQLTKMNIAREKDNKSKARRHQVTKKFTQKELWVFFGLLLSNRLYGGCEGEKMFKKHVEEGLGADANAFNANRYMNITRFCAIKKYIPIMFADETRKEEDPWWQIVKAFEDFNDNRKRTIAASSLKTLDELISAYCPQTTKTGNIPHLSYIIRKPEPLGTEFKNVVDTKSGICTNIRLCRKKTDKAGDNPYEHITHLKTAQATLHLMKGTKRDGSMDYGSYITNFGATPDTYLGDAWFASVDLAYHAKHNLGVNFIGIVKTNSSRYPKKFLIETMATWPGGSHLLLQTEIEGVRLYALGYKYCAKKVMCFIFNDGAGHTEAGLPYIAKWTDKNGNRCERRIGRPHVCSTFFENNNKNDIHNQMRQYELRLEKCWVTCDGYFRIITSLLGITTIDAWRGYQKSTRPSHRHCNLALLKFVDMAVLDMLTNDLNDGSDAKAEDSISSFTTKESPPAMTLFHQGNQDSQETQMSELTWISGTPSVLAQAQEHRRIAHLAAHQLCIGTDVVHEGGVARTQRKRCHQCYGNSIKSKTSQYCSAPACQLKARGHGRYWICKQCWDRHVDEVREEFDAAN